MKMKLSTVLFAVLGFYLGVGDVPRALAYVPPSQYMIKTLANKKLNAKAIRVKTVLSAMPASDINVKTLTVYDTASRLFRVWILDDKDQKLYKFEKKADELSVGALLLFEPNFTDVTRALVKAGVPIKAEEELVLLPDEDQRRAAETLALRRWRGNPAWIIGKPEKANPQLWLEKDSFLPIRLLTQNDIQFEAYGFFRGFPFPKTTTVLSNEGQPLLKEELVEILTGPTFAELKTNAAPGPNGYTDLGNGVSGAVRDLVEAYFKTLR